MLPQGKDIVARIWNAHCNGLAVSQICEEFHLEDGFVRSTIKGIWRADCRIGDCNE